MSTSRAKETPPPVIVRRSRIQGRGVFASRDFRAGQRIVEYTGEIVTDAEADARCDDDNGRRHHTFLFDLGGGFAIDASRHGNDARFINHSCEPNCESEVVRRRVYILALRDIEAGEELTYDYWYVVDGSYTLDDLQRIYPCRCKAPLCRGTLARPPRPPRR